MNEILRADANAIISASMEAVKPDEAVARALQSFKPGKGRTLLVSTGKAAWQMAYAAVKVLGSVDGGVVVTKYDHVMGEIPGVLCCEGDARQQRTDEQCAHQDYDDSLHDNTSHARLSSKRERISPSMLPSLTMLWRMASAFSTGIPGL